MRCVPLVVTLSFCASILCVAQQAVTQKPTEVKQSQAQLAPTLQKMQEKFNQTKDFSAQFTQTFRHHIFKTSETSTGSVQYKKPGKMRWDYKTPSNKSFIVEGSSLWIFQPADKLAMVDKCFKQDTLSSALSFLWGAADIKKQFTAQFFDGQFGNATDIHIQLDPKTKSNFFKRIILVLDPVTFTVKQSIVVDLEGNLNQFVFEQTKINSNLSDNIFSFTPPAGIHISNIPGSNDKCKASKTKSKN